jgi:hypothetical protein
MGFDLQQRSETFTNNDNQDWLGSAHGVDAADSVTLDAADLLAAFADGQVPSGVEIGKAAGGLYQLGHGVGLTDHGFLLHAVRVRDATSNPVGAKLWHGKVITARVPLPAGGDAPVAADHPLIQLV